MAKKKNKKKDLEIIKEIRSCLTNPLNLQKGLTSIQLSKLIDSKKETIERYLEILMFLELVAKKDTGEYFYQPPQFHRIPLTKINDLFKLTGEIAHISATGGYIPSNYNPPKVSEVDYLKSF